MLKRLWREDEGILTFEWILLLTVLVIGVIGGVGAIRDAIIHEAQGVVGAMVALDQSYYLAQPLTVSVQSIYGTDDNPHCTSTAVGTSYADTQAFMVDRNQYAVSTGVTPSTGECPLP